MRWDYLMQHTITGPAHEHSVSTTPAVNALAERGREGWELVTAVPQEHGDLLLIFKKPLEGNA